MRHQNQIASLQSHTNTGERHPVPNRPTTWHYSALVIPDKTGCVSVQEHKSQRCRARVPALLPIGGAAAGAARCTASRHCRSAGGALAATKSRSPANTLVSMHIGAQWHDHTQTHNHALPRGNTACKPTLLPIHSSLCLKQEELWNTGCLHSVCQNTHASTVNSQVSVHPLITCNPSSAAQPVSGRGGSTHSSLAWW
jgi:hypothetical protein